MAARTWQCQVRTPPGRSPCLTSPTPIWRLRVRGRQRAGASHGGDPVPRRTRRHIGGCGGPAPGHGEPPRAGGGSFSVPGRVGRAEIDHACDREHPGTVLRRRLRARAPAASRPAHEPMTTGRLDRLAVDRGWRCVEIGAGDDSVARWLAGRVGPTGHVVATDILCSRLLRLGLDRQGVCRSRAWPRPRRQQVECRIVGTCQVAVPMR